MSYPSYPRPGYPSEPTHSAYPGQAPTPGYPSQSPSYPGHHHQGSFSGGPPPPTAPPLQAQPGASNLPTTGQVEGVTFRIDHRDSNSMLYLRLQPGAEVKAKPGSMVAMDATVKIKGKMKFSVKKMITGVNISESIFTGPGEVMVAPETWGDIVPIHLDGRTEWRVGKDAYLACTPGITRTAKSQGIGATLFSGEGLFVHNVVGAGMMWVTSLGAIVSRTLQPGEQWIVDNGHLVAWTANYKIERIDAGGFFSSSHTDEGAVCRFTGPGIVYIQSRNPETLGHWIREQLPSE
ncbi:tryptophan RNA-binding attenuator protein-like domain-containing protein [Lenzites betulinus]|nr:tryptophan RNA-binding attenuator protein-like domain-containing protein [Lenzites betulinus]